jgi:hypothetical protein
LRPFWPQVFPAGRKEDRFKCYCDAKEEGSSSRRAPGFVLTY